MGERREQDGHGGRGRGRGRGRAKEKEKEKEKEKAGPSARARDDWKKKMGRKWKQLELELFQSFYSFTR